MPEVKLHKVDDPDDRKLPVFEAIDTVTASVRECAHRIWERRGFDDGHAVEDWLQAERRLCWPAAKLEERDKEYILKMSLAGFEPSEVEVTVTPREIIVHASASSKRIDDKRKKDCVLHFSEFRAGDVYRRIDMPTDITPSRVSASLSNGLLTLSAPKASAPVQIVPVNVAA